jgi:ABC-type multidrug transport system fused ATPase/permease subunit
MKRELHLVTSQGFLLGLSLLLANDFLFKPLFHNWLTGKLSDFAGLFVFPLFWTALWPKRKRATFLITAAGFAFWKSSLAQPFIDAWNQWTGLALAREVDASDLLALSVLLPSYKYHSKFSERERPTSLRPASALVIAVSLFAFTATSYRTHYDYTGQEFVFADNKAGLVERLKRLQPHTIREGSSWKSAQEPDEYTLEIKRSDFCFGGISALVEIKEENARQSRLVLKRLEHECPEGEGDREKMLLLFNHEIVNRLQDDIDARPSETPAATPSATPSARPERSRRAFMK